MRLIATALAATLIAAPALAQDKKPGATVSHGLTLVGDLKYPADFKHLEYLHTRCLRLNLGKKAAYISRLSNAAILRLARAETLASQIRRKQLKLLERA